jgi:metal-responsive CopG/Arc/MetJ family transcriptional regulator
MITINLPEKYVEVLDAMVEKGLYPNRSEAIRMATYIFVKQNVDVLVSMMQLKGEDPAEVKKLTEAM